MKVIPLVRASALSPIVGFLDQIGSPIDRLLEQISLTPAVLDHPDNLLPLHQGSALIENAANLEGLKTLGFLIGRQTPTFTLGTLGTILNNCLTLFDLLMTMEQLVRLDNSGEHVSLRWENDSVWWQVHYDLPTQGSNLQTHLYGLGLYLSAVRVVLGPTWRPTEIHLEGPPCRSLLAIDDFADTTIHGMSSCSAIKMPRAALSLPYNSLATGDDFSLHPAYEGFQKSAPASAFFDSLQQFVQALLPYGSPNIALVAAASGLSVRSLQRHLTEAGLTYSKLIDQVRFNRAVALLRKPDVKLLEVALELGYTDPANFARAFRRWAGVSPREYRLLHG
ncbi:AraC family transcriptional regulator [Halomicronema sp. CCY15110]|uniref:AraC family transcriptional regulator n=1 Tax=Halomicronema sp. CCY15110 TaxID=2767773 RepID=UPI0019512713|nr:AraC family transcriptional regulator [Halomicronema sp. CCY15110]